MQTATKIEQDFWLYAPSILRPTCHCHHHHHHFPVMPPHPHHCDPHHHMPCPPVPHVHGPHMPEPPHHHMPEPPMVLPNPGNFHDGEPVIPGIPPVLPPKEPCCDPHWEPAHHHHCDPIPPMPPHHMPEHPHAHAFDADGDGWTEDTIVYSKEAPEPMMFAAPAPVEEPEILGTPVEEAVNEEQVWEEPTTAEFVELTYAAEEGIEEPVYEAEAPVEMEFEAPEEVIEEPIVKRRINRGGRRKATK